MVAEISSTFPSEQVTLLKGTGLGKGGRWTLQEFIESCLVVAGLLGIGEGLNVEVREEL